MTAVYSVVIAMGVVVILLGMLVVGLLRSHADVLQRLESAGTGLGEEGQDHASSHITLTRKEPTPIPELRVAGTTPSGEPLVTSLSGGAEPTLVAFLSTTCSSCTPFWDGLESSRMYFGGQPHRVLVVTLGETEESPTRAQALAKPGADVVMSSAAWKDFEVPGAPFFVLVEPGTNRVIGEGTATTYESLIEFLTDATNDQQWDLEVGGSLANEENRIDTDLRQAGILPGDARLYPEKGDISEDGN